MKHNIGDIYIVTGQGKTDECRWKCVDVDYDTNEFYITFYIDRHGEVLPDYGDRRAPNGATYTEKFNDYATHLKKVDGIDDTISMEF